LKKLLTILFLNLILTSVIFAQQDITKLKPDDIPDAKILSTKIFDGNSLWGYIDGGADIYLEYGFVKLTAQEVELNKSKFKVEIYKMKDAEAAFGIFSVSHRNCAKTEKISKYSCATAHQVQFAYGKFYVSVVNENGTVQEQEAALSLAKLIFRKLKGQPLVLPRLFRKGIYSQHKDMLKFVRGNLGLQKAMPEWEELFDGIKNYSMFVLPIELNNGYINVTQVDFKDKKNKINFLKRLGMISQEGKPYQEKSLDGKFRVVKELSATEVIYFESNLSDEDIKPYLVNIKVQYLDNKYCKAFEYINSIDTIKYKLTTLQNIQSFKISVYDSLIPLDISSFFEDILEENKIKDEKSRKILLDSLLAIDRSTSFQPTFVDGLSKLAREKSTDFMLFFSKPYKNMLLAELFPLYESRKSYNDIQRYNRSVLYMFYFGPRNQIEKVIVTYPQYD
jgi:hypothetical protein